METLPEAVSINSPLLFKLFDHLETRKHSILDISQANKQSLEFYSDYHCKLYLSNSSRDISELPEDKTDTPHKWHRALVNSFGFYKQDNTGLDIILLWDFANYLESDRVKGLVSYLLPQCSKNTLLHLYVYNSEHMADKPADYRITTENKVLLYQHDTYNRIDCPCYNLKQLQDMLKPFQLEHSVMLSSGIQEYLFQLAT